MRPERRSMRRVGVSVVAAVALCAVGLSAEPQERTVATRPAPAGDGVNGKKLYNATGCWSCHGYSGQGARTGARLAPNPIPYAAFVRYVRAPGGDMPPYSTKVLSDAQVTDIYAFLAAIPRPRDAKEIPLLKP